MALKGFYSEEWWPVLLLTGRDTQDLLAEVRELAEGRDGSAEIPDDLIARHEAAIAEFRAVQDELWKIIDPAVTAENDKRREAAAKRGNPHVGPTWQYPDG